MKKLLLLATASLAMASCARFPGGGAAGNNTQVKFRMTVAGRIKPNYVYMVAIRWSKNANPVDPDRGPFPVIASPWGNGFVAGRANVFMRWDAFQSPEYQVFQFTNPVPDDQFPTNGVAYMTNWVQKGVPLNVTDIGENSRTLEFTLDMSQIAESAADIPLIRALAVNFLTMDRVPQDPDGGSKYWDGLGANNSVFDANDFIQFSVDQSNTYSNSSGIFQGREPSGDTPDPDLDIVDWSVQVIRP